MTAFADSRFGEINITKLDNRKYMVQIDGRQFNAVDQTITVSNMDPGYHDIKIYAVKKGNPFFGVLSWPRKDLIYDNSILVKPWRQVNITIKRSNVSVDERRIGRGRRDDGYNGDERWNDRNDDYGDYDRDIRIYRPINESDFFNLKQVLRRENFENNRLALARQNIGASYFTVEQVRQLMQLFAFEDNKLEIATFAYGQTVDKNNYFRLCEELSYSRSKDQLTQFIQSRQ